MDLHTSFALRYPTTLPTFGILQGVARPVKGRYALALDGYALILGLE